MPFPVLTTPRLHLRPVEKTDFDNLHRIRQYPEVVRHITGKLASAEDSWNRILRAVGHWHILGFGFWIIEDRNAGTFLGEAGLLDVKRDVTPSLDGTIEAGWALLPEVQGKGYAMEAMIAILGWGEAQLGNPKFSCIISPENLASLKLASRLGFRQTARTTYLGDDILVLHRKPAPASGELREI